MTLPTAIICDLDGTLCDHRHRLHHVRPYEKKWVDYGDYLGEESKGNCGYMCFNADGTEFKGKDYEAYYAIMGEDKPNEAIYDIICRYAFDAKEDCKILFVTGRPEKYRKNTEEWLNSWIVPFAVSLSDEMDLFMRPDFIPLNQGEEIEDETLIDWHDGKQYYRKPDHRPAQIVKKEIYEREIKIKYNVLFCLESNREDVSMYRDLGLTVLDCGI